MTESVSKDLKEMNVDNTIILGGRTKNIQVPDVYCNKPFKARMAKLYDQWPSEGVHKFTEGGNLKLPSWKKIIEWLLDAWSQLSKENAITLFKCSGLNIANMGMEDDSSIFYKRNSLPNLESKS